jgi:hypothetical protein
MNSNGGDVVIQHHIGSNIRYSGRPKKKIVQPLQGAK